MSITYSDLLITALTRHNREVAFVQDGREITYGGAADTVARLIHLLSARGVAPGKGVAVLAHLRPRPGLSWQRRSFGKADKRELRHSYWRDQDRALH